MTSLGKLFHVRAAATGNARSPTVDSRVGVTSNAEVDDDRRRRRSGVPATGWRVSARFPGCLSFQVKRCTLDPVVIVSERQPACIDDWSTTRNQRRTVCYSVNLPASLQGKRARKAVTNEHY